jgi:hypothetical protein
MGEGLALCAFHTLTSTRHHMSVRGSLAFPTTWVQSGRTVGPGMSGRLAARHHMGAATALVPVGARRRIPVCSARLSPGASLGVFKDRPSIDMGNSRQLLRGSVGGGWPLRCPRFGPTLPGVKSCSAFTVSRRPGGLLRVLSCGFVAPRCRSWGSPSFGPAGRFLAVPGGRAVLVDASALRSFSLARSRPSLKGSCLPAVRLPEIRSVRLQGLAPRVKSAASAGVATDCRSLLPWAFLPQDEKKGSPFPRSPPLARNCRAVGARPFPRATWPWNSLRSPGLPVSDLAVFNLGREGGAAAVFFAEALEARGAIVSFRSRFRSVPDASIRSRLESARGVGPRLSLVAMTPATRDLHDASEI